MGEVVSAPSGRARVKFVCRVRVINLAVLACFLRATTRDVKFVFFPNSNFVCKIRILFELRAFGI